ncbi:MAG: hypothetical protein JW764_10470 [Chlorobiaceae bacterium]|nr:hypothetical protein [Chlorobiaceae bacterium]
MKLKALRYGEFFQGKISTYNHQRPVFIHFLECIRQETQEWLVDFYPKNGLTPGMVLSIDHHEQSVLCEIIGRKRAGRFVRLLNPGVNLEELWAHREVALAE